MSSRGEVLARGKALLCCVSSYARPAFRCVRSPNPERGEEGVEKARQADSRWALCLRPTAGECMSLLCCWRVMCLCLCLQLILATPWQKRHMKITGDRITGQGRQYEDDIIVAEGPARQQ